MKAKAAPKASSSSAAAELETISVNRYEKRTAEKFTCFKCGKSKESNIKVEWNTMAGSKVLCDDCYKDLMAKGSL